MFNNGSLVEYVTAVADVNEWDEELVSYLTRTATYAAEFLNNRVNEDSDAQDVDNAINLYLESCVA